MSLLQSSAVNVLITYDYGKENTDKLSSLGYNVIIKKEKNLVYTDELKDVEILVTYNPFSTLDISKMRYLKWIQLFSNGFDQLPKEYIISSNIMVTNNKTGYNIPIAEWIILKILELYKSSSAFYKKKGKKIWQLDFSVLELSNKVVGILGTGGIAIETAKRLKGFDVVILGCNTNGRPVSFFDKCYPTNEMNSMLEQCDIVVSLLPSTRETYHCINESSFLAMKEGVVFINVGRGNVVDEDKLTEYIKNKRIRGAALDVFEKEPLDKSSCLWDLENVIITPHNSWVSEQNDIRLYNLIYENLRRYKKKEALINVSNIEKGY